MKKKVFCAVLWFFLFVNNSLYSLERFDFDEEVKKLKRALKLIKREGCLYGIFMQNLPIRLYKINRFERMTEKKAGMIMFFINWEKPFPEKDMKKIINYGAIPHIVWEPSAHKKGKQVIKLKNIINGEWDSYLTKWAKEAKKFGYPFLLRLGHEMDGTWYPWSGPQNGKNPKLYIKMWKHVWNIFDSQGAKNVIWVWTPMNTNVVGEEWNEFYNYYPGDKYVDWVGMDAYNWGNTQSWSRWTSFEDIFADRYYEMIKRYPKKPMIIGEFASATRGGDKAKWIKEAFGKIKNNYAAVKAFVWFNINKECDWRIHATKSSLESFKQAMKDPYFYSDAEKLAKYFKNIKFPQNAVKKLVEIKKGDFYKTPETKVYFIKDYKISIDGKLGDWPKSAFVKLGRKNVVKDTSGWEGENDVSGIAAMMISATNLYIAFSVKDDKPFINFNEKENIWNGDGVEVAFNMNPSADRERECMGPDDIQIGFGIKEGKVIVWSWQIKKELKGAKLFVRKTDFGYVLEAKIPFSEFAGKVNPPPLSSKITLNFAINDSDSDTREHQLVWSGDESFYRDPSTWGIADVVLIPY